MAISRQIFVIGFLVSVALLVFSQPGTPPAWNNPGTMEYSNVTLYINCTCPEHVITAVHHTITIEVTIITFNAADNATHADITLQWGWSRIEARTPTYESSELTYQNLTIGETCRRTADLYIRAIEIGILPGQSGYNYLMLTYTIGYKIYSGSVRISTGGHSNSENMPVIAGADSPETLQTLLPLFAFGTGLILAIIISAYYFQKVRQAE